MTLISSFTLFSIFQFCIITGYPFIMFLAILNILIRRPCLMAMLSTVFSTPFLLSLVSTIIHKERSRDDLQQSLSLMVLHGFWGGVVRAVLGLLCWVLWEY